MMKKYILVTMPKRNQEINDTQEHGDMQDGIWCGFKTAPISRKEVYIKKKLYGSHPLVPILLQATAAEVRGFSGDRSPVIQLVTM